MHKPFAHALTIAAVLSLLAACGGGGNDSEANTDTNINASTDLNLSGTAAVGHALADAWVSAKCAKGSGSTSTDSAGRYALAIPEGALPCVIRVTGEAKGQQTILHSLANEASERRAIAHLTPLTEMALAQLTGALPSQLFDGFDANSAIDTTQLATAIDRLLSALKEAGVLDASGLDPFKTALEAATAAGAEGNDHDHLLDQLGAAVPAASWPQLVTRIASAGRAPASNDSSAPALGDVAATLKAGVLPNCQYIVGGKYRLLHYFGDSQVVMVDFKNLKIRFADSDDVLDIATPDAAKPCEFSAKGSYQGSALSLDFAMGTGGAGALRATANGSSESFAGHIFPVQAHAPDTLKGSWNMIISGAPQGTYLQRLVTLAFDGAGKVRSCEYGKADSACKALAITARTDGGVDAQTPDEPNHRYAGWVYQSPNGGLTLYSRLMNTDGLGSFEYHGVAAPQRSLSLPEVGRRLNVVDITYLRYFGVPASVAAPGTDVSSYGLTYTAVDTVAGTATHRFEHSGNVDTLRFNKPLNGTRSRPTTVTPTATGTGTVRLFGRLQLPLNSGVTVSIPFDADPGSISYHSYSALITR